MRGRRDSPMTERNSGNGLTVSMPAHSPIGEWRGNLLFLINKFTKLYAFPHGCPPAFRRFPPWNAGGQGRGRRAESRLTECPWDAIQRQRKAESRPQAHIKPYTAFFARMVFRYRQERKTLARALERLTERFPFGLADGKPWKDALPVHARKTLCKPHTSLVRAFSLREYPDTRKAEKRLYGAYRQYKTGTGDAERLERLERHTENAVTGKRRTSHFKAP